MKLSDSFLEEMHKVRAEQLANAGLAIDQPANTEATEEQPAAHVHTGTTDTEAEWWWGEGWADTEEACAPESQWWLAGSENDSQWWASFNEPQADTLADLTQSAAQAHAADTLADLTQSDTVANAAQAHAADTLADLTQSDTVANAAQAHAADTLADLTQSDTVANAAQAHASTTAANAAPTDEGNAHAKHACGTKPGTTADRLQKLSLPEWTPLPKPKAKAKAKSATKKPAAAKAKSAAQPKPKARAPQGENGNTNPKRKETDYTKLKKKFLEPLQSYNKKEQEKRRGPKKQAWNWRAANMCCYRPWSLPPCYLEPVDKTHGK